MIVSYFPLSFLIQKILNGDLNIHRNTFHLHILRNSGAATSYLTTNSRIIAEFIIKP